MKRRAFSFRIAAAVLASAWAAWPSAAGAATTRPVAWWIETHPWTCSAQTGPLARQVQLACDATGRCAIAGDEASAERRAVLVCGDDGWTLEARDAKGEVLWTLALGAGDDEGRLRKASVWIARSEGEGPLDVPAAAPAPAATSPAPVPAARVPAAPPPVVGGGAEADHVSDDARAARVSLAAMFHASVPRAGRQDYGTAYGARGLLVGSAPRVFGPFFFGVDATAESSSQNIGYSLMRAGLLAGLNVTRGDFRVGLSVEGGPAFLHLASIPPDARTIVGPNSSPALADAGGLLPYVQASAFVEWALPGHIHPFVSPTATWLADRGFGTVPIPNALVGLDVGLVWGHM